MKFFQLLIVIFVFFSLQTCSQLIKAGLKLSIQSKRKLSSGDSSGGEFTKYSKRECDSTDDESIQSPKTGVS